jgi:hypothetical protein
MTTASFIRKWLANPEKHYDEHCRNEMLDDLYSVIEQAQTKQKLNIHGVSGKRPDLHCQNACDWPNCTLPKCVVKSSAACANGGVDKTVSAGNETIDFAMYLTGHDEATITQMKLDWERSLSGRF